MGFWNGLADGFTGAASGTWEGVKSLAKGGHALATDPAARERAWETTKSAAQWAGEYADKVADDPAKLVRDARDGALAAYTAAENFAATADAEDWGKLAGGGLFEVGTALIPVGVLAKAGKLGKLSKVGKGLDKAEDIVDAVEDTSDAAKKLDKAAPGCVEKCRLKKTKSLRGYTYEFDDMGRVKKVSGELKLKEGKRNPKAQLEAGGIDRLPTDEGGHLIANRFSGPSDAINHVPQNMNLNRSAWKKMENTWAKAIKEGKKVEVEINIEYPENSLRPDKFIVEYKIDERTMQRTFRNQPGG